MLSARIEIIYISRDDAEHAAERRTYAPSQITSNQIIYHSYFFLFLLYFLSFLSLYPMIYSIALDVHDQFLHFLMKTTFAISFHILYPFLSHTLYSYSSYDIAFCGCGASSCLFVLFLVH
eukprot:287542_1